MKPIKLITLVTLAMLASAACADDWTAPRAGALLQNYTFEVMPTPLSLAWEYATNPFVGNVSQPVVVGDTVVFATGDRIRALDSVTGAQKWTYPSDPTTPMGSQVRTSLAAYNGKVYFGSNDGSLYCLSLADGKYLWAYATQSPVRSSPTLVDGRIYFGSDDNALHCVDADTGEPFWTGGFRTNDDVASTAAVSAGLVYFLSRDTRLYVANSQTGRIRWSMRIAVPTVNLVPVPGGDVVYLGASNTLLAMGARSGLKKWMLTFPAELTASPAVAEQTIFVPLRNHMLYAVTAAGKLKWAQPVDTIFPPRSSPTVAGNLVIVASDKGLVSAFDTETGMLKWRYLCFQARSADSKSMGNNNISSSPVWANGTLYVLPDDGTLRAFKPETPDASVPEVFQLAPAPGSAINGSPPLKVSAVVTDAGSGVDDSSIVLALDGDAREIKYDPATGQVNFSTEAETTMVAMKDGRHQIVLTVKDWKGNEAKAAWSFVVDNSLPKPKVRVPAPRKARTRQDNTGGTMPNVAPPNTGAPGGEMMPPAPPPPPGPGGDYGGDGRRGRGDRGGRDGEPPAF